MNDGESRSIENQGHDIGVDDMLEYSLNAYLSAQDNEFHTYIIHIKTGIDNGLVKHTANQLNNKAFNFYNLKKKMKHETNNPQSINKLSLSWLPSRSLSRAQAQQSALLQVDSSYQQEKRLGTFMKRCERQEERTKR